MAGETGMAALREAENRTRFQVEMTTRVERLEEDLAEEKRVREKSYKYIEHLLEDVQTRYHQAMAEFGAIRASMLAQVEQDRNMKQSIETMDGRMRVIERLTWIAVGGVAVITGLLGLFAAGFLRIKGMG